MQRTLLRELGQRLLVSVGIFTILFALLYVAELIGLAEPGQLLQWSDAAFVLGIPASVLGVGYVMTITNPKNYMGFYPGVVMSLLLSAKFYLTGSYDLIVLYLLIFIPFQVKSIVDWRRNTLHPSADQKPLRPRFLSRRGLVAELLGALAIVVADFAFAHYVMNPEASMMENWPVTLASGVTIAASFLANLLLIYQLNDAWLWWVIYSLSSLVLFILLFDPFLIVLNIAYLLINGRACVAWIKMTAKEDRGWTAGSLNQEPRTRNQD